MANTIAYADAKCQYGFGLHWQFSSTFGLTTLSFIWSNLSFSEICLSMFPFGFCSKIRRARLGKTKGFDKYKVTHQQIHQLMTKINPKHLDFSMDNRCRMVSVYYSYILLNFSLTDTIMYHNYKKRVTVEVIKLIIFYFNFFYVWYDYNS